MNRQTDMELKVGLFVTVGVGLTLLAILVLGSSQSLLTRQVQYTTHFSDVSGLVDGAKAVMGGIQVGTVKQILFDAKTRSVSVCFSVEKAYEQYMRKDTTVEIQTQGVLGDKYLSVLAGSPDQPALEPGSDVPNKASQDISQFLSKGDRLMVSLNSIAISLDQILKSFQSGNRSDIFFQGMSETAHNMAQATDKLNHQLDNMKLHSAVNNLDSILAKIDDGTGTLGELVNDPGLYYDVRALLGGANRNKILRNLVRDTIKKGEAKE